MINKYIKTSYLLFLFILLFSIDCYSYSVRHYSRNFEGTQSLGFVTLDVTDIIIFRIEVTFGEVYLCDVPESIVQDTNQYNITKDTPTGNAIQIKWESFNGCGKIYEGVVATGTMDEFPDSFDIWDEFRLYCNMWTYEDYFDVEAEKNPPATTSTSTTTIIENNPPYSPSNPYPENKATDIPLDVMLSWDGGDPDEGDTVLYDLYFGDDIEVEPPLYQENIDTNRYEIRNLRPSTMYLWSIVARDDKGEIADGDVWLFTTMEDPDQPGLPCAINSIFDDDPDVINVFRYYQDQILSKTSMGRKIIKLYYKANPILYKLIEENPELKESLKHCLKQMYETFRKEEIR